VYRLFLTLIFSFLSLSEFCQVPAFPGAGGGGAQSVGGRGGKVYEVTNLDDSGSGSLRAGVEMDGPRTIVFRVGGTISVNSGYKVKNPYITIAGQTAPGGGIQIDGRNTRESIFMISTNDVIIRYLRMRHGTNAQARQTGDLISVTKGYNIIVDHCSMMWTTDENADAWGDVVEDAPRNVTISWNILAEPLKAHPTNFLTGSGFTNVADAMKDIDAHHNLMANSSHRNPLIKNKTFRFVNNIVYNWIFYATMSAAGVWADIVGNYYRPGPLNDKDTPHRAWYTRAPQYEIEVFPVTKHVRMMPSGDASIYVSGNIGPNNSDPDADNWVMVTAIADENGNLVGPLDKKYRRMKPLPDLVFPIKTDKVQDIEKLIIPEAGASHRLDQKGNWVFNRDFVDMRIIEEYHSFNGFVPVHEEEVGGFPVIEGGKPYKDKDHDGMPDKWEKIHNLNPRDPSDGSHISGNGYSNLENFINGVQKW